MKIFSSPSDPSTSSNHSRGRVRYWRTVLVPVVVVAVIALAVWWIDYGPGSGGNSDSGDEYGAVDHSLSDSAENIGPQEGSMAPDFLLEVLNGEDIRLSDRVGHPIILNFWATWCAPCRWEIPQLVEIQESTMEDGLLVLAINLQEGDDVITSFIDDYGVNFPVLLDREGEVAEEYNLLGVPTTYFIDRDGVISGIMHGAVAEEAPSGEGQEGLGDGPLMDMVREIIKK